MISNHRRPSYSTATVCLALMMLALNSCLIVECQLSEVEGVAGPKDGRDLDVAASESNNLLTAESHKIIASGWPSTSSMWPTVDIDGEDSTQGESHWFRMVEPFIYADKPRTGDYSLLLNINSTVLEALRAHLKPMSVSLSFEYYFNHGPKSTALPLIKIEVNRKEFKYLDPNGQNVRSRRWMKFSERIQIADLQQLEKHDWLKISLVNRDEPSFVAIRRLKAEFRMSSSDPADVEPNSEPAVPNQPNQQIPEQEIAPIPQQPADNYGPPPSKPAPSVPPKYQPTQEEQTPDDNQYRPDPSVPPTADNPGDENEIVNDPQQPAGELAPQAPVSVLPGQQTTSSDAQDGISQDIQPAASEKMSTSAKPTTKMDADPMTSASEALSSTIKPVTPSKKKGWGWTGKRRRRRDTNGGLDSATVIELTCQRRDSCDWQSDSKDEGIQWSLARMPSSTSTVKAGYHYVSNQNTYGDSSKLLRISLNQTERATIADQHSDHCIDLAVYVTERTLLRMYRLTRIQPIDGSGGGGSGGGGDAASSKDDESSWLKGNLLMSWAPTMAINDSSVRRRVSLPGARLVAMESDQNGWTVESLCFGDFFANSMECGAGKCAFGFIMDADDHQGNNPAAGDKPSNVGSEMYPMGDGSAEQVVGVSILREYSQNIPVKASRPKWLEIWQRDEVEPGDGWKFYPKLDYTFSANNISLANMFDGAHYYIESDWLLVDHHLDLTGTLLLEDKSQRNLTFHPLEAYPLEHQGDDGNIFTLRVKSKLVDASFNNIFVNDTLFNWNIYNILNGSSSLHLNMSITDHLRAARGDQLKRDSREQADNLFKIVLEFVLDLHWLTGSSNTNELSSEVGQYLRADGGSQFEFSLVNVSVSDRCYPNQCEHGTCQQNGTGLEDWSCQCEDKYRGRRCEFGHWCNVPHVTQWNQANTPAAGQKNGLQVTLKIPHGANGNANTNNRQPKLAAGDNTLIRVTGEQFCKSKLGPGFKCTDIDLPLNDNVYTDEDKTFYCSCKSDYYLSDDSKCRQTHACNSILCPSIGMICDETRAFNQSQPCHCNEKQDWFPNPEDPQNRCVRRQCHDKQRDCGFDAHLCIPTLPGERPICKCGPKFTLKTDEKGKKYCQSTACVLPTLNDCQQICVPDNSNMTKPYTCDCHPGFKLDEDGRSCKPERAGTKGPHCRPACPSESQICTDHGCHCKQGFVGEGEQKVRRMPKGTKASSGSSSSSNNNTTTAIEYTESIRCLNICSLSYAENKEEFEMIESVCPLGLCDPNSFQCRCSDPTSASLANEKYEPIYANCSSSSSSQVDQQEGDESTPEGLLRVSPLCHLKRVCEPDSSSYKICKSQGAICVPDYTKPAKFDCICPPSTEKRFFGQGTASEFTCDSKCSSKKSDCLRKQAVCKQIDRDQVRCDCLPGFMLQDNVCYLARYSYSMNLMIVNKYYEPEARFHRLIEFNSTTSMGDQSQRSMRNLCPRKKNSPEGQPAIMQHPNDQQQQVDQDREQLSEILPQFNKIEGRAASVENKMTKSMFIADYNQCNISQVLPRAVIEDPYEHDIESYLGYIEQCNEKIHQSMRNYHLNSRLSEDIRQSLRQHLREFTVTTNNSSCIETDPSGMLLNCTIFLQSNEPIEESTINFVFSDCEKNAHDNKYCWIKPRLLLLKKQQATSELPASRNDRQHSNKTALQTMRTSDQYNFRQIVPCEISNFCGLDAVSLRIDDKASLCSCKCPTDIEVIDVKDLEPRRPDDDPSRVAVKEICAPRNHCGANSTHCLLKPGSVCQYDIRTGSRCICVYPSYEDSLGKCVEVTFSQLDSTLIIIIIMLGTALLVSVFLNILVAARTKSMFGRSKQYPLNEFSSPSSRQMNRSTGVPNPVFEND